MRRMRLENEENEDYKSRMRWVEWEGWGLENEEDEECKSRIRWLSWEGWGWIFPIKWQLSQAATSQVWPSCSARPQPVLSVGRIRRMRKMRIIWSMKRSKRVGTGRSGDEEDKLGGMSRSSLCLIKKIDIINVAKPWNLRRESWLAFA